MKKVWNTLLENWPILLGATVFVFLAWLTSGTLSPYATTAKELWVDPDCGYFFNGDYPHHLALFRWLEGAPRDQWEFSVVLRRVLYPILAYPFYYLWGFARGGWLFNVLAGIASILGTLSYYRRKQKNWNSRHFLLITTTYMGWFYWTASPFSYGIILPLSFLNLILLEEISRTKDWNRLKRLLLGMGVLFLGYDLLMFFLPACLWLIRRKQNRISWRRLIAAFGLLITPTLVVVLVQKHVFHIGPGNSNTATYGHIFNAFFHPSLEAWQGEWIKLRDLPWDLLRIFLYANFQWVPGVFLLAWASYRWILRRKKSKAIDWATSAEKALALSILAIAVINQIAPNYPGWQMRGTWISRLYQPAFVLLVIWTSRLASEKGALRSLIWSATGITALAQVILISSPWWPQSPTRDALVGELNREYLGFYDHSPPGYVLKHLEKYGARGLGMCEPQSTATPPEYLLLGPAGGVHHDSSWRGPEGHEPVF